LGKAWQISAIPNHCVQEVCWRESVGTVVGGKIQGMEKLIFQMKKEIGFLLITDFKLFNQMKGVSINYCEF